MRHAVQGCAIRVFELQASVTNEWLWKGFSSFGEVERALVLADERGKSVGEGIVEFATKKGATNAIQRINEGIFFLTAYVPYPPSSFSIAIFLACSAILKFLD